MKFPNKLNPDTAERCWIIWGPCSGGMKAYLLYQDHVFFYGHYVTHGEERDGVLASDFLKNIQRPSQFPNIQEDLIALGYAKAQEEDV